MVVDMRHLTARHKRITRRTIRSGVDVVVVFLLSAAVPDYTVWFGSMIYNKQQMFHKDRIWTYLMYIFFGVVTVNSFIYAFSDRTILAKDKKILRKLVGLYSGIKATSSNEEEMNYTRLCSLGRNKKKK